MPVSNGFAPKLYTSLEDVVKFQKPHWICDVTITLTYDQVDQLHNSWEIFHPERTPDGVSTGGNTCTFVLMRLKLESRAQSR